jgi:hypothetical protein
MDLYFFARILVRFRAVAAATLVLSLVVSVVLCFTLPRRYTSGFTVLSPDGGGNTLLKSLGNGAYNTGMKGWVIPAVLGNEEFALDVMRSRFTVWENGIPVQLSIASIAAVNDRETLRAVAPKYLKVSVDEMHGSVRVRVETPHPELSYEVARYTLEKLQGYASDTRLKLEAESAQYYNARIREAHNALLLSESELGEFFASNRGWLDSDDPGVKLELQRLERRQEIYSGIYFELHKQKEIDGLKALSMVPSLDLLDTPSIPRLKSFPRRKIVLTAGGLLGVFLSIAVVFILESCRRLRKRYRFA